MEVQPQADRRKTHGDETLVPELPPEMFRLQEAEGHLDRQPNQLQPRCPVPPVKR